MSPLAAQNAPGGAIGAQIARPILRLGVARGEALRLAAGKDGQDRERNEQHDLLIVILRVVRPSL